MRLAAVVLALVTLTACSSSGGATRARAVSSPAPGASSSPSSAAATPPGVAPLVAALQKGFGAHRSAHFVETTKLGAVTGDLTFSSGGTVTALRYSYTDPGIGAVQLVVIGTRAWLNAKDFCLHGKPWHAFDLSQDDDCLGPFGEIAQDMIAEISPAGIVTLVRAAPGVQHTGTQWSTTIDTARLPDDYRPRSNDLGGVKDLEVTLGLDPSGAVVRELQTYNSISGAPVRIEYRFGPFDTSTPITPPPAAQVTSS